MIPTDELERRQTVQKLFDLPNEQLHDLTTCLKEKADEIKQAVQEFNTMARTFNAIRAVMHLDVLDAELHTPGPVVEIQIAPVAPVPPPQQDTPA